MPLDLQKHLQYWTDGADEALQAAVLLIDNGRYSFRLFFMHLALEKMLKAMVTRYTLETPAKTHNLVWLAKRAALDPPAEISLIFNEFRAYCMEGRYPDSTSVPMKRDLAKREMLRAKEAYTWLHQQLKK